MMNIRFHLRAIAFSLVVAIAIISSGVVAHGQPTDQSPHLTWDMLSGTWNTYYLDDDLGGIAGKAKVDGQTVTLTLTDPQIGRLPPRIATSASIEGDELVLIFERIDIEGDRQTGENFPDEMIKTKTPGIASVTVKGGTEEIDVAVAAMPETDTSFVEIRLKPISQTTLSGRWRYRVHPFIGRAEDGRGRAGGIAQDDEGVWWASNGETWHRPEPQVYGTMKRVAVPRHACAVGEHFLGELVLNGNGAVGLPFRTVPGLPI